MTEPLPLETQTLYAELLEHLLAVTARRTIGLAPGALVSKTIKKETYLYWQVSEPGGRTRQLYLGRRSGALDDVAASWRTSREALAPDLARADRLAAQLRAGRANVVDAPSARVIRSLSEAGVFDAGAVLVGTHAFIALGNVLGRRWSGGSLRTYDVDLASSVESDVDVAIADVSADVPTALESLQMGFLPVPSLDPKHPSTSFKVRGRELRVDLLAPRRGSSERPIFIKRFNAAAQPLEFLDYVIEMPERALVVNGGASLVNVPHPGRFALHKLLVAPLRPAVFQTKAAKDVAQAAAVLEVLLADRPGDVELAWTALVERGTRWDRAFRRGLSLLASREPKLHARLRARLRR